jgi:hypothetical protein
MRQDRERYLAEIIAQHDGAPLYWLSLMGITESSKPASFRLVHMAVRIGETAVMFYKDMFRRPRPSEVCPGLMPPFGPPGHPAFPSGHSTQGHLISQLLAEVAPRYAAQLGWLADRVAINRERAGFHYRSDSDAGKFLAAEIFRRLMGSAPSGPVRYGDETDERRPRFRDTLEQARGEWA